MTDKVFWRGKKVFITGHTGFKGSWLSLWLSYWGADVIGYALEPPTDPSLFELAKVKESINSINGDIRDRDRLMRVMSEVAPEIVIHMAAQPIVRESYKDPVTTYETNVMGTVNIFEAIRNCKSVRAVVNVTTDKCYENKEWCWGYRENEPMGGYDPYSNSKACSELVTASYRASFFNPNDYQIHGVGVATARAGNVIGGGDWATDRLVPDCVRALLKNEKIVIRNPKAIRPWQHVLEPLSGYLILAERLFQEGPAYAEGWNFGPNDHDARPVEWIVRTICEKWGGAAAYSVEQGQHLHEANSLKLDCSKAKIRLGWSPKWDLGQAIDQIITWTKVYQTKSDMREECFRQIQEYTNA